MTKSLNTKTQQPEALAELARSSREATSGEDGRSLTAIAENSPLPTKNVLKHKVAETLLAAGAEGKKLEPRRAGIHNLPDRTRVKNSGKSPRDTR